MEGKDTWQPGTRKVAEDEAERARRLSRLPSSRLAQARRAQASNGPQAARTPLHGEASEEGSPAGPGASPMDAGHSRQNHSPHQ